MVTGEDELCVKPPDLTSTDDPWFKFIERFVWAHPDFILGDYGEDRPVGLPTGEESQEETMRTIRVRSHQAAAVLLGLSLLGGGALATDAATPSGGAMLQATPGSAPTTADDCVASGGDNVQEENGADDAAEGDTDSDAAADEATEDAAEGDEDNVEEENGGDGATEGTAENGQGPDDDTGEDEATARPGELSEGQDLLSRAGISPEQAVQAARGAAAGEGGSVELEERSGQLVYEVMVGDQEVFVDAAAGAIVTVEPTPQEESDEDGCQEEALVAPGTLTEGMDLLPRASLTIEQATTAAQGAVPGLLGAVELKEEKGTLLFEVEVGNQVVAIDAVSGAVLPGT